MSADQPQHPAWTEAEIVATMPTSGRKLVEVLGFLPAIDVMRKHGGKRFNIPATITDRSAIVVEVGMELASKLVAAMPDGRFEVPTIASVERFLRDRALTADFAAGASFHELVDKYRVSQRHTRKLLIAQGLCRPGQGGPKSPQSGPKPDNFPYNSSESGDHP